MIALILMFFFVSGISEFTYVIYDIIFYNMDIIISNDMWLFGTYTNGIIIENSIVDIAIELKKEFKSNIDNPDPSFQNEIMDNFLNRWGLNK